MLTAEDKEDIRRIVAETVLANLADPANQQYKRAEDIVEVTARAMEVFGAREKALRWLNTPLRSLGDRTPLSLLETPEGVAQVQDTLGRVEHGVW
jgi:putative toxin-antitoxin system antitoxin component (TIGR02293 family)